MGDFFKTLFNRKAPAPLTPVEILLKERGAKYKRQPDGTLVVRRDLDLGFRKLESLPDLSSVVVQGNFSCSYNETLTSLAGAPRRVDGEFRCKSVPLSYVGPDTLSFGTLVTDHGAYKSWEEIPAWLRLDVAGKRALIDSTPAADTARLNDHLAWALRTEDADLAKICIDKGADVNRGGGDPLIIAANRKNLDLAGMLCLAGADIDLAVKTARKKWWDAEDCDYGQLYIADAATHDYYWPIDRWLTENAGALREKVQLYKIQQLQEAKTDLEQRVTALQADAAALEKPLSLDKPKFKPPSA
ncbi:MAG: ankyrin repeat domain-containing protein [Alphaproteobacteria bacterium]|nr:MAG: ankyrin repeat domain-containing protein [Alphaproteobacteria bacterium]